MPTSVKMKEADKARLDRLQARLTGHAGRRIPQDVLMARLVTLGEAHLPELAGEAERNAAEDLRRLRDLPVKTGVRTREEDIDRSIYGADA